MEMKRPKEVKGVGIESPVVVYQEEGYWVAHCLALDLVAHGATEKEARESLVRVIATHIDYAKEHGLLDSVLHMAPKEFWEKFDKSSTKWRLHLQESRIELEPCLA